MSFRLIADIVAGNLISKWLTSPSEKQIQNDDLKKYRPPCIFSNLGQCISIDQEHCKCLKMANTDKEALLKAYGRLLVNSYSASMSPEQAADMKKFTDELARRNSGSSK